MRRLTSLGDEMNWKDTLRKELDPVGQEDGDIDNDGDKDRTDEYLLNRRKKITEEVEKGNCGCGQDPCKTYGVVMVKKGKGESGLVGTMARLGGGGASGKEIAAVAPKQHSGAPPCPPPRCSGAPSLRLSTTYRYFSARFLPSRLQPRHQTD